jgi:hypothetical protein
MPLPPVATQHGDEFCSTECARQHYGCGRGQRTTPRKLYVQQAAPRSAIPMGQGLASGAMAQPTSATNSRAKLQRKSALLPIGMLRSMKTGPAPQKTAAE